MGHQAGDRHESVDESGASGEPGLAGPTQRARLTCFAEARWESEVSFYCPRRDRALSLEECRACRDCGAAEHPDLVGCADPLARRIAGEALLRAPRPRSLADRTPLWQVMRPTVICVSPGLALDALLSLFVSCAVRAVPVVDGEGRPVGVVSRSDLALHRHRPPIADGAAPTPPGTVADVMMCIAFTLREDAMLSHAAALMAYEGIHRIPVVCFEGKVVGVVTSMDVVRWLAQHDGYVVPDSRNREA
jgi:CBS domain-containing protein